MQRLLTLVGGVVLVVGLIGGAYALFHRTTWGAIYAVGGNSEKYGVATNAASKNEADDMANQECQKSGVPCIQMAVYDDACAAVVHSSTHFYETHQSSSLDDAISRALSMCREKHADDSCKQVVAACSAQAAGSGR